MQNRSSENKQPDNQSLPNIKVLRGFLHLYQKVRAPNRDGYFATFGKRVGIETAEVKLKRVVSEIESKIDDALIFDDFYNLIFTLREKAEFANTQLTWAERSLLSVTLHAMADFIISHLNGNILYYKRVESLKQEVADCTGQVKWDMEYRHGKGTLKLEAQIDAALKKLAYLADNDFCYQARRVKLLENYPLITEDDRVKWKNNELLHNFVNVFKETLPLQLQSFYCQFIYALEYQPCTKYNYKTFLEKAKNNELINNLSDSSIEEKALSASNYAKPAETHEEKTKQIYGLSILPANTENSVVQPILVSVQKPTTPPGFNTSSSNEASITDVTIFKPEEKLPIVLEEKHNNDSNEKNVSTNSLVGS